LDIAWVKKRLFGKEYYHVGIYLGNGEICHMADPGVSNPVNLIVFSQRMKANITNWTSFLEGQKGELRCYHPIIPFKDYKKIIEQATKVWWVDYKNYCLANRNCEHLANSIVYGINYSKQVQDEKGWYVANNVKSALFGGLLSVLWHDYSLNNGKGGTICLKNEINSYETNGRFDNLTSDELRNRRNNYEKEYETRIEQPIKTTNCVIM